MAEPDIRILVGNIGDASPSGQSAVTIRNNLETALASGIKVNIVPNLNGTGSGGTAIAKTTSYLKSNFNYAEKQLLKIEAIMGRLNRTAAFVNIDGVKTTINSVNTEYKKLETTLTQYGQRSDQISVREKDNIAKQIQLLEQLITKYNQAQSAPNNVSNISYADQQLASLSVKVDVLKQKLASLNDVQLRSAATTELQQQYNVIEQELYEYATRSNDVTSLEKENIKQRVAAMAQLVAQYEKLDAAQAKSMSYADAQKYKAASAISGFSTFDTAQAQQAIQIQQNLNAKLDEYAARKTEITAQEKVWVQEQISAIKRLVTEQDRMAASAEKVAASSEKALASQSMQAANLNQYLTTVNPKALTEFSSEIARIRTLLASGVPGDAQKASAAITQLKADIKAAGYEGGNAVTYLVAKLKTFVTYMASSMLTMGVISGIRNMITNVKDLDEALTDLRIVTGDTREETEELLKTYNQMAQQLGTTTVNVSQGATDWLRQGYSEEDARELLKQSMTLSIVGDMDSTESTDALTSAIKGYQLQVSEASDVVDKFFQVDMKAATSSADLAVALAKTAANAKLAGLSLDDVIGQLAVVNETLKEAGESTGGTMRLAA